MRATLACLASLALVVGIQPARAASPIPLYNDQLQTGIAGLGQELDSSARLGGLADTGQPVETPNTPLSLNPVSFCAGSLCLGSVCAFSACFGSACILSGCGGSGCLDSGCGGSGCVVSGCLGSICVASGCVGSICVGTGCVGSVCASGSCTGGNAMRAIASVAPRAGGVELAVGKAGSYRLGYRLAGGATSEMTVILPAETVTFIRLPAGVELTNLHKS